LRDIRHLLEASRIRCVLLGGKRITSQDRVIAASRISDFAQLYWSDIYTRDRVAELLRTTSTVGRA